MELAPGTRIGRIRIDALLGAGGMGEVYRGWDEKLERAVALKVVHADKRLSPAMHNRFLREARVLSKLDHPNICRIYDVLERGDGDYLVLELVDGVTVRERVVDGLSRRGALEVALSVARVLAVTHAQGLVHRDLKPDNIMLTRDGQVKVLDFGLAREVMAGDHAEPLSAEDFETDDVEKTAVLGRPAMTTRPDESRTLAGSLVGTLSYMSPEQARGLPLTEATDVYSLGVVLREMLSRDRVYGTAATMNDLLTRVRAAEVEPFDFGNGRLNRLIKKMLSLYPSDRPRAEVVVRELEEVLARPARVRRRMLAAAGIAAILLMIGGAFFLSRRLDATRQLFAADGRGKLAILPFHNATGDASLTWIEHGLAQLVTEGVSRAKGADIVAAEDVGRAMRNLKLRSDRDLDADQRRALLAALGADVAIQPTVVFNDGKYTIRYAALRADGVETPRETTSTIVVEAARQMSVQLAQRIDPATSAAMVRARYSLDATANMLYAMGMQELQLRGPRVASHYFTVCIDRDPEFLVAKMQLANAHHNLAEDDRAEKLLSEAIGRARERNDREMLARGFLTRASWAIDDGSYAAAERSASDALAIARAVGDDDLIAAALASIAHAAWRSGGLDRATALYKEALQLYVKRRDVRQQAETYNDLGVVASSAQRSSEARQYFEKSLAIADRVDDRLVATTVVGNLAMVHGDSGNFPQAETVTRRQVSMAREMGDLDTEIIALINLGLWLYAQGKEQEAVKVTNEATSVAARLGNPRLEAILHSNLATAATKHGDLDLARRHNDTARAKSAGMDDPEVLRDVELGVAYALIREGRLDAAARAIDRAARWQENGRTMMLKGRLAYARGEYDRAFALLTRAKTMDGPWLIQNEQMLRAFEESARTNRASNVAFEDPLINGSPRTPDGERTPSS